MQKLNHDLPLSSIDSKQLRWLAPPGRISLHDGMRFFALAPAFPIPPEVETEPEVGSPIKSTNQGNIEPRGDETTVSLQSDGSFDYWAGRSLVFAFAWISGFRVSDRFSTAPVTHQDQGASALGGPENHRFHALSKIFGAYLTVLNQSFDGSLHGWQRVRQTGLWARRIANHI